MSNAIVIERRQGDCCRSFVPLGAEQERPILVSFFHVEFKGVFIYCFKRIKGTSMTPLYQWTSARSVIFNPEVSYGRPDIRVRTSLAGPVEVVFHDMGELLDLLEPRGHPGNCHIVVDMKPKL